MHDHLSKVLLKTREGLIVVVASLIYLTIGLSAKFSPSIASFFGFIGFMALFMPIFLILVFFKMRGFKSNFQSNWYNTAAMLFVALIPAIVVAKSAIAH
jgi:hypothetical protein